MAYIRSNEDWYQSMGYNPREAKVQAELDRRGVDHGLCNPRKAKLAAEEEAEVRRQIDEAERLWGDS